jgi:hypothetical protein
MRLDSKRDGVCPLELPSLAQFGVMAGFLWRSSTGVETMRLSSKKDGIRLFKTLNSV